MKIRHMYLVAAEKHEIVVLDFDGEVLVAVEVSKLASCPDYQHPAHGLAERIRVYLKRLYKADVHA